MGTKTEHAQLEKKLVSNIKKISVVTGYTSLLKLFYGFYQPLEQQLEPFLTGVLPDFADRRKAEFILRDLATLGEDNAHYDLASDLPDIHSRATALGAAYVLEGSTLGGAIIAKMISGQLGVPVTGGFAFFTGYGERTLPMWERFRASLNTLSGQDEQASAIEAARQTFIKFNQWAGNYEPIL